VATALSLSQLAAAVKPGDMLGFSGRDLLSDAINLGTWGIPRRGLSHVAIVAHYHADLCLYESTTTVEQPCLIQERSVSGVQCHRIEDRVGGYEGRVWHYPLASELPPVAAYKLEKRLIKLCRGGWPYDPVGAFRSRTMLLAILLRLKFGHEDFSKLFCSELVSKEWVTAGVLETTNASKWNPNALARYVVRHGICLEPTEVAA